MFFILRVRKISFFIVSIFDIYVKFLELLFFDLLDKFSIVLLAPLLPLLSILLLLALNIFIAKFNNLVIFNIEINNAVILLKP